LQKDFFKEEASDLFAKEDNEKTEYFLNCGH